MCSKTSLTLIHVYICIHMQPSQFLRCMCVCECVHMHKCVCVRVCIHVCVHVHTYVCAWYVCVSDINATLLLRSLTILVKQPGNQRSHDISIEILSTLTVSLVKYINSHEINFQACAALFENLITLFFSSYDMGVGDGLANTLDCKCGGQEFNFWTKLGKRPPLSCSESRLA